MSKTEQELFEQYYESDDNNKWHYEKVSLGRGWMARARLAKEEKQELLNRVLDILSYYYIDNEKELIDEIKALGCENE